ncbi:hypothetical protein [Actinoplanes auranticolor]|uniref:Uncharacterized protein n=1 Tax=Actinoplanes auranticolor TaxID=47988 RepID=A0A919VSW4_9ACTN|nr:hypothetical protein [Actinoplanes auranticolor]GIM75281.1 hypothetical protein Aau02nite_65120 [Actinoplanes auranticolor]
MRLATAAVVLGLAGSLTACAHPGNTPSGTPAAPSDVTFLASIAPAPPRVGQPLVPGTPAVGCDGQRLQPARPKRWNSAPPRPTTSAENDAAERTRRALEAANPPLPRRGPLPSTAAARAETCARNLSPQLTLLLHSPGSLDERTLRALLTREGLTGVVISPALDFAAAAGDACVHGRLAGERPDLSIGPPDPDGTCHP